MGYENFSDTHSGYHLSCTAKMGKVVNPIGGAVYGTENLRCISASVMPSMCSGNLNAPTIMLAEKLVSDILGEKVQPADDISWWKCDVTKQREGGNRGVQLMTSLGGSAMDFN